MAQESQCQQSKPCNPEFALVGLQPSTVSLKPDFIAKNLHTSFDIQYQHFLHEFQQVPLLHLEKTQFQQFLSPKAMLLRKQPSWGSRCHKEGQLNLLARLPHPTYLTVLTTYNDFILHTLSQWLTCKLHSKNSHYFNIDVVTEIWCDLFNIIPLLTRSKENQLIIETDSHSP